MNIDLQYLKSKQAEIEETTRKWILATDASYQESEKQLADAESAPLRHPRGESHDRHNRKYLWSDALWCQDRGFEPLELWLGEHHPDDVEDFDAWLFDSEGGEEIMQWFNEDVFNEVFRRVMPVELHSVLEG